MLLQGSLQAAQGHLPSFLLAVQVMLQLLPQFRCGSVGIKLQTGGIMVRQIAADVGQLQGAAGGDFKSPRVDRFRRQVSAVPVMHGIERRPVMIDDNLRSAVIFRGFLGRHPFGAQGGG